MVIGLTIDLEEARLNRERVKRHNTDEYYDHQAEIASGWQFGKQPPKELRLGELPQIVKGVVVTRPIEMRLK